MTKEETLFNEMEQSYLECGEHCRRVADLALAFCHFLNIDKETAGDIHTAALFHDIGKLSIPDAICEKPSSLSPEEWALMEQHVCFSAAYLKGRGFSETVCDMALHHHERWDGHGYTQYLKGEEIPYGSRIIAICDSFDAMTSPRCYHVPISEEDAIVEIRRNAGEMYDPELVDKFLEFMGAH